MPSRRRRRLISPVPELPEVEVVRRGLEAHVADGARIGAVEVLHPRPVRRHVARPGRLRRPRLTGGAGPGRRPPRQVPLAAARHRRRAARPPRDERAAAGAARPAPPDERHLRVRLGLDSCGRPVAELRFVDQRMFGGLAVAAGATPTSAAGSAARVPSPRCAAAIAHIARDPLDPSFDEPAPRRPAAARRTGIKRALLDQTLVSGVGNIYADEALWRARLHGARPTERADRPADAAAARRRPRR